MPSEPLPAVSEQAHPTGHVIIGNRACHDCGYCLEGQPIVREQHYGMVIARCPECGTVAALQEYPSLSGWGRRLGAIAAVSWAASIVCTALMVAAVIEGQINRDNDAMLKPLLGRIEAEWSPIIDRAIELKADGKYDTETPAGRVAESQLVNFGTDLPDDYFRTALLSKVDAEWLDLQPLDTWRRESLSLTGFLRSRPLIQWVNIVIAYFMTGAITAGALYHLRWRGKLVIVALLATLVASFGLSSYASFNTAPATAAGWAHVHAWAVAWRESWPITFAFTSTLCLGCIAAGLCFGRPIARELLRLLLPPRACHALAGVWHVDGLEPPATRTSRARARHRPCLIDRSLRHHPAS